MAETNKSESESEWATTPESHALSRLETDIALSHGVSPDHVTDASVLEREIDGLNRDVQLITEIPPDLLSSPEAARSKDIHMPNRTPILIRDELEPIGRHPLPMHGGIEREVDVVAVIRPQHKLHHYEVVSDGEGMYGLVFYGKNGPEKGTTIKNGAGIMGVGDEIVAVNHNPDSPNVWSLTFYNQENIYKNASLQVATSVEQGKVQKSALEKERNAERRKHRMKRGIGAMALFATLTSGGGLDIVADHFDDTDATVARAFTEISDRGWTMEDTLDGITISDFTHPEEVLSDLNAPTDSFLETQPVIEHTMQDLDTHNYQAIQERADQYVASHPGELLPSHKAEQLLESIRSAKSKEQVVTALSEIIQFYGMTFEASEGLSLEQLQNSAAGIAEGIILLPKSLVGEAALDTIKIATPKEVDERHGDHKFETTGGYYNRYDRALVMRGISDFLSWNLRANTLPGVQEGNTIKDSFLHEFAHSLDAGNAAIGMADTDRSSGRNALAYGVDLVAGGLLNIPQAISTYSRDNLDESIAENLSGVISDRTDGLPHPDDVRRFNSPAGQTLIQNLASLEAFQPGLADYFVSVNQNLMNRRIPVAAK